MDREDRFPVARVQRSGWSFLTVKERAGGVLAAYSEFALSATIA